MTSSRAIRIYGASLGTGAALFFLVFAAVFNGLWPLLLLFMLWYAAIGALGVRFGGVAPLPFAIGMAAPAVLWVSWLFPASVAEAGLVRALLWPGLVLLAAGLAWLGGVLARAMGARSHQRPVLPD